MLNLAHFHLLNLLSESILRRITEACISVIKSTRILWQHFLLRRSQRWKGQPSSSCLLTTGRAFTYTSQHSNTEASIKDASSGCWLTTASIGRLVSLIVWLWFISNQPRKTPKYLTVPLQAISGYHFESPAASHDVQVVNVLHCAAVFMCSFSWLMFCGFLSSQPSSRCATPGLSVATLASLGGSSSRRGSADTGSIYDADTSLSELRVRCTTHTHTLSPFYYCSWINWK